MSERRAWDVPVDEIKTDTLKAALVEASGIITHAAKALGILTRADSCDTWVIHAEKTQTINLRPSDGGSGQ